MGEGGGAGIHAVCAALQDALRPLGNPIVTESLANITGSQGIIRAGRGRAGVEVSGT